MKQRYGTLRAEKVPPRSKARDGRGNFLVLSAGFWSLSTLSSVPYVRVLGPSGTQKEFSWNEMIEVPSGETAQVMNASYHVGDIVLNGGQDFGALPSRITVPVSFATLATPPVIITEPPVGPTPLVTAWKADTRRCRRAFLMMEMNAIIDFDVTVRGFAEQRSHRTVNGMTVTAGTPGGVGYQSIVRLNAATNGFLIPLGFNASVVGATVPHVLLDAAEVRFSITEGVDANWTLINAYYVLEYS